MKIYCAFLHKGVGNIPIELCLALLKKSGRAVEWHYIQFSASELSDGKDLDYFSIDGPIYYVDRPICQGFENTTSFEKEDLSVPLTDDMWERLRGEFACGSLG